MLAVCCVSVKAETCFLNVHGDHSDVQVAILYVYEHESVFSLLF